MAKRYSPTVRAQVIAAKHLGESSRSISRRMGISHLTIDKWFAQDGVRLQPRTQEELTNLLYDTLVVTLKGLHARAVAAARPAWIEKQSAEALARLDEAHWNQLTRVLASFRPVTDRSLGPSGGADSGADRQASGEDDEDGDDEQGGPTRSGRGYVVDGRNGAVDSAA